MKWYVLGKVCFRQLVSGKDAYGLGTDTISILPVLVSRSFLACCSRDAVGRETVVVAQLGGERFRTTGLMVLERNWLDVSRSRLVAFLTSDSCLLVSRLSYVYRQELLLVQLHHAASQDAGLQGGPPPWV